ncbi:AraC-like ligand-binding domain-containing protein [Paraburkholderia sp. SG-MS1]|uniref:AraC-like ligand-binding domain-containing protein n=1 Tax=Paraburkholderia sp. SG-MS1 TaxID=2023741 RepID=UPI00406C4E2F
MLLTHLECYSTAGDAFSGTVVVQPSNVVSFVHIKASLHAIARGRTRLAQSGEERVFIVLQTDGEARVEQDGRQGLLKPGDMTLLDTSRTFHADFPEPMSQLVLQVPRALVRKQVGAVERFAGTVVPTSNTVCKLTWDFVQFIVQESWHASR